MMLLIGQWLSALDPGFDVLQYITLRAIFAALTALIICLVVGPILIRWLAAAKIGQTVRNDGPQTHLIKAGTPTMGGAMIIMAVSLSTLLWSDLGVRQVWVVLFVTIGFGAIGWVDDYRKVVLSNSVGLTAREKLLWQTIVAGLAVLTLYLTASERVEFELTFPFFKDAAFYLGWGFLPLSFLVIVGSSNAVNLTDGLDGLAILPSVMVAAGLGLIAYLTGHAIFADYLGIPNIKGAGELTVFCSSLVGAGLGFLWFNTYPAQVFMGDVGALSIGASLGVVAIMVRQELLLFIMGGIFVHGSGIGHSASRLVQDDGQAYLSHGTHSSSFRTERLARAAHHRAVLDHHLHSRAGGSVHPEDSLMNPHELQSMRVLIVGYGVTGASVARFLARYNIAFDVAEQCDEATAQTLGYQSRLQGAYTIRIVCIQRISGPDPQPRCATRDPCHTGSAGRRYRCGR